MRRRLAAGDPPGPAENEGHGELFPRELDIAIDELLGSLLKPPGSMTGER